MSQMILHGVNTVKNNMTITHTKTAFIDGDIIAYSVGFAANKDPVQNALHSVKIMIRSMLEATGADSYRVYLTGDGNYREEIATIQPYKGNRKSDKPIHYEAIRDYLVNAYDAVIIDGKEADDAMGIAQTNALKNKEHSVICTIDKDLNMIAGEHYNWRRADLYNVNQSQADLFFMRQLLEGDRVDNIPGIPGYGPKKAQAVIDSSENMSDLYWNILDIYSVHYDKPFEAMMENANLLWIQREEDKLWNPLSAEFANV